MLTLRRALGALGDYSQQLFYFTATSPEGAIMQYWRPTRVARCVDATRTVPCGWCRDCALRRSTANSAGLSSTARGNAL